MPADRPITILCVTSYEKGQEFLRTCKSLGCTVLLLTVEKFRHANWPHEAIDEMFFMPPELPIRDMIHAVSYAARTRHIDRIVALDEFDMENVAALREHLRLPGMGLTMVRYFRDKLAMRMQARDAGILVPEFSAVLNYDDLREFMQRVPGPWLLKPRAQASGIGMKKITSAEELWPWLDQLGDNNPNTCSSSSSRAAFFTSIASSPNAPCSSPKPMPMARPRWRLRTTVESSPRERCRAIPAMRWL